MEKTLLEFAEELKAKGFRVFLPTNTENPRYAYFSRHDNLGYVQIGNFGGFDFSSVHKPNHECGTGFSVARGVEPTVERAYMSINHSGWSHYNYKKYASVEEFLKAQKIITYREL